MLPYAPIVRNHLMGHSSKLINVMVVRLLAVNSDLIRVMSLAVAKLQTMDVAVTFMKNALKSFSARELNNEEYNILYFN